MRPDVARRRRGDRMRRREFLLGSGAGVLLPCERAHNSQAMGPGRQARRPARAAANQIRASHQSQDGAPFRSLSTYSAPRAQRSQHRVHKTSTLQPRPLNGGERLMEACARSRDRRDAPLGAKLACFPSREKRPTDLWSLTNTSTCAPGIGVTCLSVLACELILSPRRRGRGAWAGR